MSRLSSPGPSFPSLTVHGALLGLVALLAACGQHQMLRAESATASRVPDSERAKVDVVVTCQTAGYDRCAELTPYCVRAAFVEVDDQGAARVLDAVESCRNDPLPRGATTHMTVASAIDLPRTPTLRARVQLVGSGGRTHGYALAGGRRITSTSPDGGATTDGHVLEMDVR